MSSNRPVVDLNVAQRLGTLELQVKLRLAAPWTVLFGPSGSGKSSVLRVIAGLLRPENGRVEVLGERVSDTVAGVWVPAHRRRMRWAGQRAALFPRMTVRENVAEGLGPDRTSGELDRVLEVFGLRALAGRWPAQLSGGQRQMVSLVRAAAGARGRVLLLDEPFAGLDAALRDGVLAGLRAWCPETPVISVTHDVGEAFLLDGEIVRVHDGQVVAQGPARDALQEERERLAGLLQ